MTKFPWRAGLYAVILLYLFFDLRVCRGPLREAMTSRRDGAVEAAILHRWVAIVNQEPLTREQLDLAVVRHLHQRGRAPEAIPEKNLLIVRRAVLQSLIDETLVRQYADGDKFVLPEEEIAGFVEAWEAQFASPRERAERSGRQGLSEKAAREELARIWSRKRWLERRIAPGVTVEEGEARAWFEANRTKSDGTLREGFYEPEKVHARHIQLLVEDGDVAEREALVREIRRRIGEGESTWEEIAATHSDDLGSKERGGDLSWFSRERMPRDFVDAVFALEVGELSEPFLTRLGWHIVEIIDRQPERPVFYEEVADEIRYHLESQRTEETLKSLMKKLRTVANIQLFPENI